MPRTSREQAALDAYRARQAREDAALLSPPLSRAHRGLLVAGILLLVLGTTGACVIAAVQGGA